MHKELEMIIANAHNDTFHMNNLEWGKCKSEEEKEFCSLVTFGDTDHYDMAKAYIAKELIQLAEIERHVAGVITLVLGELQEDKSKFNIGYQFQAVLHTFAMEELNHANTFTRYSYEVLNEDIRIEKNYFNERLKLYSSDDSPYVKLLALHTTAYIGETLITIFENRLKNIDKEQCYFITKMLVAHGLDEHRHIEFDHFIFEKIQHHLNDDEIQRAREIALATEEYNKMIAYELEEKIIACFGDYKTDNYAYKTQLNLTKRMHEIVYSNKYVSYMDDNFSDDDLLVLQEFTSLNHVHSK